MTSRRAASSSSGVVWGVASALQTSTMLRQRRHQHHRFSQHRRMSSTSITPPSTNVGMKNDTDTETTATATDTTFLLHPDQMGENGMTIPYPKSLSPSSISTFKQCPQSFLFQYLWGLKQPTNLALAKGSMCHAALEQVFDLPAPDRTLDNLQNLFRREWGKHRLEPPYDQLFQLQSDDDSSSTNTSATASRDIAAEVAWGQESLHLLEQYMQTEDPSAVARPNPVQREVWVRSHLTVRPAAGVTGYTTSTVNGASTRNAPPVNGEDGDKDTFLVRGIIDRLDMVSVDAAATTSAAPADRVVLRLIDYKTGKAPLLKYSPAVNRRIQAEAFEQLLIYALLWREQNYARHNNNNNKTNDSSTLPLRFLRLFYLTSHSSHAQQMEMDLGATAAERDAVLQRVHADLAAVWNDIMELVSTQDATAWRGCDRAFCYCHSCRARFVPGTVWEPPTTITKRGNSRAREPKNPQGLAA